MGMHFGILAVRAPLATLADRLAPLGIGLGDDLGPDDELPEELVAGEHAGDSYVVDPMFDLSAHGDFVRQLSDELQTMVVGCGAETVSGTFWVFAADNGRVLRSHWSCAFDLATAFDEGDWCRDLDLAARDGEGLFALLRRAGFDYDAFAVDAPKRTLSSPLALRLPNGALHERLERHRDAHRLPEDVRPAPHLDVRDFPGALLDFDLTPHGQPEPLPPPASHDIPSPRRDRQPHERDAFVDPAPHERDAFVDVEPSERDTFVDVEPSERDAFVYVGPEVAPRRSTRVYWYFVAVAGALTWLALRLWWSAR